MRTTIALAPVLAALTYASPVQNWDETLAAREAEPFATLPLLAGVPIARPNPAVAAEDPAQASSVIIPDTLTGFPADATPVIRVSGSADVAATVHVNDTDIDAEAEADADVDAEADLDKRDEPFKVRKYAVAAVNRHNIHRANHGAGPVTWSPDLAKAAMKSAQRCTFAHYMGENGLTYGQNLALGTAAPDIASIISDGWYSEVVYYKGNYGQAQPDYGTNMEKFSKWGHFTQVVWKDTTKIGCATWRCKSVKRSATDSTPMPAAYGGDVTYCNYQSPGNYGGQYAANVGKPKEKQSIPQGYGVNRTAIAITYSEHTGQKW